MSLRSERTSPKSTGCALQLRLDKTKPKVHKQERSRRDVKRAVGRGGTEDTICL